MRGIAFAANVFCLLLLLSAYRFSSAEAGLVTSAGGLAPSPAPGDSLVTRIPALQQEYGVGSLNILTTNPPLCYLEDEPLVAGVSWLIGGVHHVWVIWDMTAIPQNAEILGVEIEHVLDPLPDNRPGIRLQYRSLTNAYLPPPDCWAVVGDLGAGFVYADVEMGTEAGTRRVALGDSATSHVAGAVGARGYFSLWITNPASVIGGATLPGWSAGGPELIVAWKIPVAVKGKSWGAIRSLYSRPPRLHVPPGPILRVRED